MNGAEPFGASVAKRHASMDAFVRLRWRVVAVMSLSGAAVMMVTFLCRAFPAAC